jgi:hypothetical protein
MSIFSMDMGMQHGHEPPSSYFDQTKPINFASTAHKRVFRTFTLASSKKQKRSEAEKKRAHSHFFLSLPRHTGRPVPQPDVAQQGGKQGSWVRADSQLVSSLVPHVAGGAVRKRQT